MPITESPMKKEFETSAPANPAIPPTLFIPFTELTTYEFDIFPDV